MLLPIGRDDAEIRRHAYVSYAILALNILVFIAGSIGERGRNEQLDESWHASIRYLSQHPYLHVPPTLAPSVPRQLASELYPVPVDKRDH